MFLKKLFLSSYFTIKSKFDFIKIITLGISIFLVMGAYTVFKELKDAIFIITVGTKYLPDVKAASLVLMIPLVILYGWLSEKLSRQKLLILCLLFYGIGGIIISFYIADQSIGLFNLISDKNRLFGWIVYLFLEGCSPFLVSAMWTFFNSISHPEDLKTNYIGMTVLSKLGGIVFAGSAWWYNTTIIQNSCLYAEVYQYANIMFFASLGVLCVPFVLLYLMYRVPEKMLIGYVDAIDKKNPEEPTQGVWAGVKIIFRNWYIFGIFGMTFFWEIINVIFNNLRLNVAFLEANSISGITAILYQNIMYMHIFGLLFVLFGTKNIIKYLGERVALVLIPLVTGAAILGFLCYPTTKMIFITYIIIRAINYTLTFPVREALFIPTAKNIQFKTKSWIDSFGQKFSKGCGSLYNKVIQLVSVSSSYYLQIGFFVVLISMWTMMTYYLGKKWQKTIKNKEIIS